LFYSLQYNIFILVEEKRDPEVEISSAADISISSVHGVKTYPVPTSLKLLKSVDVSSSCNSVCSYEHCTYVGVQHNSDGIVRIDEDFNVTKSFISEIVVSGVVAYKDKFYALTRSHEVRVYTLDGNQVTSWHHKDKRNSQNQLVIIDDQVVIPDRSNRMITIYSPVGEVIKDIPCNLLGQSSTISICLADSHCVVISDFSQVFKLDLTTEKVIWTCEEVTKPQGVTCYRSKYILVTNQSKKTTIWILDVKTG